MEYKGCTNKVCPVVGTAVADTLISKVKSADAGKSNTLDEPVAAFAVVSTKTVPSENNVGVSTSSISLVLIGL